MRYFDKNANCSICNKDLGIFTFKSRFMLKDGWLCSDCIKKVGGIENVRFNKDTVYSVKEKIKSSQEPLKSNNLAQKILEYKLYNPYLSKCADKDVRIACKNCNCLKDVYHTAIKYIEDDESPTSIYLLLMANWGLGILYNERTIHYAKKFLQLPLYFETEKDKNRKLMEICDILAECFKKDYLLEEELKYRKLSLDYSIAWWKDYKKEIPIPPMEFYGNKNIRKRITELKDEIKIAKKINKQPGKSINLSKPFTNRKLLKRINIYTNDIYNLITGELID